MQCWPGLLEMAESIASIAFEASPNIDRLTITVKDAEFVTVGAMSESFV